MRENKIFQIALPVPFRKCFDYLPPVDLEDCSILHRGMRVLVPFGRQQLVGIVWGQSNQSQIAVDKLKPIIKICDPAPLYSSMLCDFIEKAAEYYHHPLGEVAFTGAPLGLRKEKAISLPSDSTPSALSGEEKFALNQDQQFAFESIVSSIGQFQTFLLEGITGSGKTEIYLQISEEVIRQSKQVLILVPEISLTPQTLQRFQARFGENIICYHSRMTPKSRLDAWIKICAQQANIVIGTRSAIFLPFQNLGLIIIDEEHDPSFKQQEGFRYSARDVAVLRAKMQRCPIVLGSATPAFESLYNANKGKYQKLQLHLRATSVQLPDITLLDVRHKKLEGGLSPAMLASIAEHAKSGQVLLFINRRGYAPTLMCYDCGWIGQCERCDARLTYHHKIHALICHHCLHQRHCPTHCPDCQAAALFPVGHGTERLEDFLITQFPDVKIARIDSDATRKKGQLEQLLQQAQNKELQILIGTQILAKGHHFPHLSLVGIVDADGGLFSADFRAIERMAQLIIQVAGRAGRVHGAGKVLIQTFHPDNPLLRLILQQDYQQLAEQLLLERQRSFLPPFAHLALVRAHASNPSLPTQFLQEVRQAISTNASPKVNIFGPIPAPMLKRQGNYRYQLLIQSNERSALHKVLSYTTSILEKSKLSKKVRWSLDVDPLEMF